MWHYMKYEGIMSVSLPASGVMAMNAFPYLKMLCEGYSFI